jgi:hypothetical protein
MAWRHDLSAWEIAEASETFSWSNTPTFFSIDVLTHILVNANTIGASNYRPRCNSLAQPEMIGRPIKGDVFSPPFAEEACSYRSKVKGMVTRVVIPFMPQWPFILKIQALLIAWFQLVFPFYNFQFCHDLIRIVRSIDIVRSFGAFGVPRLLSV